MQLARTRGPLASKTALVVFIVIGLTAAPAVYADILGFDDPGGFVYVTNGVPDPTIVGSLATITEEGETNAAKAIWYNGYGDVLLAKQSTVAFYASFDYTNASGPDYPGLGEGIALVLQNNGRNKVGEPGISYGYAGPYPVPTLWASMGLCLGINEENFYHAYGRGSDMIAAQTASEWTDFEATVEEGIDLRSGNPIRTTLQYVTNEDPENPGTWLDGYVWVEMWDLVTGAKLEYETDLPALPSVSSGDTAYIGFTGGTSDRTAEQQIDNFFFENWHTTDGRTIVPLTWSLAGDGDWGTANWSGEPGTDFPVGGTGAVIDSNYTVAVEPGEHRRAHTLDVSNGGDITIAGNAIPANASTLTAVIDMNVAAGSTVQMGENATLAARGGSIDTLTTAGDATIDVLFETLAVPHFTDSVAGTLVKKGAGTLTLDNNSGNLSASHTTFRVEVGTLNLRGADPLGGAEITLAGGGVIFRDPVIHDVSTGFDNSTGGVIASGDPDPDYSISGPQPQDPATVVSGYPVSPDGPWVANSSTSKWVGFSGGSSNALPGDYDFTTTFLLEGVDPADAVLSGVWSTDNPGLDVVINGTPTGTTTDGNFGALHPLGGSGTIGAGLFLTGLNTIAFRLNNAGTGVNPAGLRVDARVHDGTSLDLSGKTITVESGGMLDLQSNWTTDVGPLVIEAGVLTVRGILGVTFDGTTIDLNATAVGVNTEVDTQLGVIDVLNTLSPLTFSKSGPVDLVLTSANQGINGFPANMTFEARGGRLIGLHASPNPFDLAALELSGGELVLSSASTPVTFDNAVTVTANSQLTAGIAAGGVADVDVTLGSAGKGLAVGAGLAVQTTDGYSLDIAGPVSGAGTMTISSDVTLSGGGTMEGSIRQRSGSLKMSADLTVGGLEVENGTVNTNVGQVNEVSISGRLRLGPTMYQIEPGYPPGGEFTVSGPDLLAGAELTLNGGTVTVEAAADYNVLGFVDGSTFAKNGNNDADGEGVPNFDTYDELQITNRWYDEAASVFHDTRKDINTNFTVEFDYRLDAPIIPPPDPIDPEPDVPADGFGFVMQGNGTTSLGGNGGGLGYSGITNSAAVLFKLTDVSEVQYATGGAVGAYGTTGTVDLRSGNVIHTELFYNGTDLSLYMQDLTTLAEYSTTYLSADIPGNVGASDAYIGFTGGTGGDWADQRISNFSFSYASVAIDEETTNITVAQNTIFAPATEAVFGDLTLAAAVTLELGGAGALDIDDLNLGNGSTVEGDLFIRGVINTGGSVGAATLLGNLEMDEGDVGPPEIPTQAGYHVELAGTGNDLFTVHNGDASIAGTLTVEALARLERANPLDDEWGLYTRTILQLTYDPELEVGLEGAFGDQPGASVPQVGTFDPVPNPDAWTAGDYLGKGVWFGDDRNDVGVEYDYVLAKVDITVFQAKKGDANGNRDVAFADFTDLASNYTGPTGSGKEWRQGDFDGDGDVDFGDFTNIASNYTGTGNYYAAKGGDAGGADAMLEGADPELIVNLSDGSVIMTGGPVELIGYSVTSASGSLLPDDFPMPLPLQFYLSNSADEITAGALGTQVLLDGSLAMSWGVDVGGLKGEPDLVFNYGTSAGMFQGNVVYVVPEPATLVLLAGGLLGLLLLWRRRAA